MRFLAAAAFAAAFAPAGHAQIVSVQTIGANVPGLGNVVSGNAGSGDTVFRISAATGAVTKVSGGGARLTTGAIQVLVTVTCTGGSATQCATTAVGNVIITNAGSPTGRARALTAFTVAPGPNPPTMGAVSGSGTSTISFQVRGIPLNQTRNFYLGGDFPIRDNSAGSTGLASTGFSVSIGSSIISAVATANVFRPLNLAKASDLAFGRVLRPSSGATIVAVDAVTGARTATGGNGALLGGTVSRAAFTITGEGGQVVSIAIPASFALSGPGSLTVTTSSSASGTVTLGSALGAAGTFAFGVGGSVAIAPATVTGNYSGTFNVIVQYN